MLRKKTATYALLALYEIAQHQKGSETGVRAGDIAQKHRLPRAYAAKLLSHMAHAGVLHSDRGPHGGFRLNRAADEISLYDVFESVGAVTEEDTQTPIIKGLPQTVQTTMTDACGRAADALRGVFTGVHLSDVLA